MQLSFMIGFVLHAVNQHFPLCCWFVPPSTDHMHASPVTHREEHAARPLFRHPEGGDTERHGRSLPQLWSPAWCPAAPQSLPVHVPAWERQGTGPWSTALQQTDTEKEMHKIKTTKQQINI